MSEPGVTSRRRGRRRALAASVAALTLACAVPAFADADEHATAAQTDIAFVGREIGSVQAAVAKARADKLTVEQRLTNGELLYRNKDYSRAIVVLSEIIEEYPGTPSYADALWLRGETYYAEQEYLAARRDYREIVDHGSETLYQSYFGKALARLVDVALRLNDPPESLKDIFDKFNQVPPAQVDAGLLYAKGKALYKRQQWQDAAQAFASVADGTPYTPQARYFQGVVAMRVAKLAGGDPTKKGQTSADYKLAIEQFRKVTTLPPDTPDHRQVIDLGWMAIGRLFYEMEQYVPASEAYKHVARDSPEFDTMLYELAWVYVRLGDVQHAERALEILGVSDPSSQFIADGTLLRADLLLRAGAFDKALELYEGVRNDYTPQRDKVDAFLKTADNDEFYKRLVHQQLDLLDQNEQLPALAVRWAREAEDGPAAFAVIDDINECKRLLHEANDLVDRLGALLGAANRAKAFPELLAGEETAVGLINRIGHSRLELARGMDDEEPSDLGGEIGQVRAQRRALMAVMQQLPLSESDFAAREASGQRQWTQVSQEIQRRSLEIDQLQAIVNGLRRMLRDDAQRGVARDPQTVLRFNAELDANEHDLKGYRDQVAELRRLLELGRAQIGFGDARYEADEEGRNKFRALVEREVQLASGGAAGGGAQRFAQRVGPSLSQAGTMEDQLIAALNVLKSQVDERTAGLRQKISQEQAKLAGYQATLDTYDSQAKDLVGQVARRNFTLVREKLNGIVLRADVGITEQAWEVHEEEMDRVTNLLGERARQEQLLAEELKEVRDDGVDPETPAGPQK